MEEFPEWGGVKDSVFVRIANIPLQESIRDLRCGRRRRRAGLLCTHVLWKRGYRCWCGSHQMLVLCHRAMPCTTAPLLLRRHFHLNQLVRVDGVVTRRTGVYPQLQASPPQCGQQHKHARQLI